MSYISENKFHLASSSSSTILRFLFLFPGFAEALGIASVGIASVEKMKYIYLKDIYRCNADSKVSFYLGALGAYLDPPHK